jgi:hypothetical protein
VNTEVEVIKRILVAVMMASQLICMAGARADESSDTFSSGIVSVDGVGIGWTQAQVLAALGTPNEIRELTEQVPDPRLRETFDESQTWFYGSTAITFSRESQTSFIDGQTVYHRGHPVLEIGASRQAVLAVLGEPTRIDAAPDVPESSQAVFVYSDHHLKVTLIEGLVTTLRSSRHYR